MIRTQGGFEVMGQRDAKKSRLRETKRRLRSGVPGGAFCFRVIIDVPVLSP